MKDYPIPRLIANYQRGVLTGHETVTRLIQAAAASPPSELQPLVPVELLGELRTAIDNPPARSEDIRFMHMGSWIGPFDHNAWQREQQASYFEGVWRWHRFLHEDESK